MFRRVRRKYVGCGVLAGDDEFAVRVFHQGICQKELLHLQQPGGLMLGNLTCWSHLNEGFGLLPDSEN